MFDFLVWTPVDCLITRVSRNNNFISEMLSKVGAIWLNHILPELITSTIDNGVKRKMCSQQAVQDFRPTVNVKQQMTVDQWFYVYGFMASNVSFINLLSDSITVRLQYP